MFVEPMLARATEESALTDKDWTGWYLEPKHDGMRAIVSRTADGVDIYSRTGKLQNGKLPYLEGEFLKLPEGTILDGELAFVKTVVDVLEQAVPVVDFNKTMRVMGSGIEKAAERSLTTPISFIIFDVLMLDGIPTMHKQQDARFPLADSIRGVWHNPRYTDNFRDTYDALVAAGIEGAILKQSDGQYLEGKRSKTWLKVKSHKTFDVIVTGFTDGQGKYEGKIGAIEFSAYHPNGPLHYVGRCSGMDDAERARWTAIRDNWSADDVATHVIEVKANEMVGSKEYRTPRHPQFVTTRIDKEPIDCTMEQFKA